MTIAKLVNKNIVDPTLALENEFLLPNTFRLLEYWIRKLVRLPTETLQSSS